MRNRAGLWLIGILAISFAMRLALVSKGPYHSDCLLLAVQSQKIVNTGQMHYLQSSGLPLTALAGALFVALFAAADNLDRAVMAVNLMSVVFGALSVGLLYLFLLRLCDAATAVAGGVLAALNPFLVGLSTFGNSHAPAMFFLMAALYGAARYRDSGRRMDLLLSGIAMGAMGAARIQDLIVMGPVLLLLILYPSAKSGGRRTRLDFFIPWIIAAAVVVIAYLPRFVGGGGSGEEVGRFVSRHLWRHVDPLPIHGYGVILQRLLATFAPPEWLLMFCGAVLLAVRRQYFLLAILSLWIIIPIAIFGQLAFFVFRFLIVTVVALLIAEAVAAAGIWRRWQKWGSGLLAVALAGIIFNAVPYYQVYLHRHHHALLVDFFRWIGEVTEEEAYVVERDHSAWVQQYSRRRFIGADRSTAEGVRAFHATLDGLLQEGTPVYITKHGLLDRSDMFRRSLIGRYRLEFIGSRIVEDWHLGFLKQVIVPNDLLRIHPR